jgi:hypothetical protein
MGNVEKSTSGVFGPGLRSHTLVYAPHATSAEALLGNLFEQSLLHLVFSFIPSQEGTNMRF